MLPAKPELEIVASRPSEPSATTPAPFQFTIRDIFHWTAIVAIATLVTRGNWTYTLGLLGFCTFCAFVPFEARLSPIRVAVSAAGLIILDWVICIFLAPLNSLYFAAFFLGRRHYVVFFLVLAISPFGLGFFNGIWDYLVSEGHLDEPQEFGNLDRDWRMPLRPRRDAVPWRPNGRRLATRPR